MSHTPTTVALDLRTDIEAWLAELQSSIRGRSGESMTEDLPGLLAELRDIETQARDSLASATTVTSGRAM